MNSVYDSYEAVIGLEVHAQLLTKSKAYSSDISEYGGEPNSHISVITLGHPGSLPVFNEKTLELAIKMGIATHCNIAEINQFARKNYFYADLPKGYQITQDKTPLCTNGYLNIRINGEEKKIGITRIHMEEDAGKSIHDLDPFFTLIDLNRAGTPLIEIVSEPDLRSSDEAYLYLTEIRKIVRHLDVCDGNMEEGSLRCDANISVRKKHAAHFGVKVEVKNMNSIRNVKRAIDFEVKRQIDLLESGNKIIQETRNFDAVHGNTKGMRSKESAHDYRYFPEPDLPPIKVTEAMISEIKKSMPELPDVLKRKYETELNLSAYDAEIITADKFTTQYFDALVQKTKNYKAAANWLIGPVREWCNTEAKEISEFPLSPQKISEIISLIDSGKINFTIATQKLFPAMLNEPNTDASGLAEKLNLIQQQDTGLIEKLAEEALAKYPEKVKEYQNGKKNLLGLFMGEVMRASAGKADPKLTSKILEKKLSS